MILKKINALLALLTIVGMLLHVAYNVFAYATMYYNPALKQLTAYPFLICVCLHAVLGIVIVVTKGNAAGIRYYPKQNRTTLIQRGSAVLMLALLVVHLNMFDMMRAAAGQGNRGAWWLLVISEVLFFAVVMAHVAASFTNALVTLGLLSSMELKRKLDRAIYGLASVLFLVAACVVVRGQLAMF